MNSSRGIESAATILIMLGLLLGTVGNLRGFHDANHSEVWVLRPGTSLALEEVAKASPENWVRTSYATFLAVGRAFHGGVLVAGPPALETALRNVALLATKPVPPFAILTDDSRLASAEWLPLALPGQRLRLLAPRDLREAKQALAFQLGDDWVVAPAGRFLPEGVAP